MEEVTTTNHFYFHGYAEDGVKVEDTLPRDSTLKWMVGCKYKYEADWSSPWFVYEGVIHTRTAVAAEVLEERFPCYTWECDGRDFPQLVEYYARLARRRHGEVLYLGNQQRWMETLLSVFPPSFEETSTETSSPESGESLPGNGAPALEITGGKDGHYNVVVKEDQTLDVFHVTPKELKKALLHHLDTQKT